MINPPHSLSRRRIVAAAVLSAISSKLASSVESIDVALGNARIEIRLDPGDTSLKASVREWIAAAAHAVSIYFGRFPVSRALVEVKVIENRAGVFGGTTYGGEGTARTKIAVGANSTPADLGGDWTMTHELVHMAFPNVSREHHWMEEGMATYVEPIARAQAGSLSVQKVWGEMLHDMPKGNPRPGDEGLDRTHSWASTYWGGALFWLRADVEYRRRTNNRRGLQQALRGVLQAGGNIEHEWTVERILRTADDAAGVPVMAELYSNAKDKAMMTDLSQLWSSLGVARFDGAIVFQDDAPLSAIRRAITAAFG